MNRLSCYKRRNLFAFFSIFFLLFMLIFSVSVSAQERPLKRLLKRGLDELLKDAQIDEIQIVDESGSRLTLEVAYSGIQVPLGVKITAQAIGHDNLPLSGFSNQTKLITKEKGSVQLTITYSGSGPDSKIQSTGLQVKIFLSAQQESPLIKNMSYFKNWVADSTSQGTGPSGSGAAKIIDPVPMFDENELKITLTPVSPIRPITVKKDLPKAIPKKPPPKGQAIPKEVEPTAPTTFAGSYYRIIAKCSNKCLEVADWNKNGGGNIQQWEWHGGDNQQWEVIPMVGGHFKIVSKLSGRCLDVEGGKRDAGANVQQWDCHGRDNQQWKLVRLADGYYKIVCKQSGKCLDVQWSGTENGTNVWQWDDIGSDAQKWQLVRIDR